jgi:peptide-methionine (S)-S-oxide reductase
MRWILLPLVLFAGCATVRASQGLGQGLERATFGSGCFWCSEAAFEQLDGVRNVVSGYMGGAEADPGDPYALVAAGHAEVVQVSFDPRVISYDELLGWFWSIHDPTSFNRQGEDEGPEYRSVIFVHSDAQEDAARASMERAGSAYVLPIVTLIERAGRFYPAAEKHQDYYARNRTNPHCRTVIAPHLRAVGLDD